MELGVKARCRGVHPGLRAELQSAEQTAQGLPVTTRALESAKLLTIVGRLARGTANLKEESLGPVFRGISCCL
jgi:hypothetical protein